MFNDRLNEDNLDDFANAVYLSAGIAIASVTTLWLFRNRIEKFILGTKSNKRISKKKFNEISDMHVNKLDKLRFDFDSLDDKEKQAVLMAVAGYYILKKLDLGTMDLQKFSPEIEHAIQECKKLKGKGVINASTINQLVTTDGAYINQNIKEEIIYNESTPEVLTANILYIMMLEKIKFTTLQEYCFANGSNILKKISDQIEELLINGACKIKPGL